MALSDILQEESPVAFEALKGFMNETPRELHVWSSPTGCLMVPVQWCEPDEDVREVTPESEAEDLIFYQGIAELAAVDPDRPEKNRGKEGTGVDTPISLRNDPKNPGRFRIKDGRRRWRGVQYAGGLYVPATLDNSTDQEAFEATLRANIANRAYTDPEQAEGFLRLNLAGQSAAVIAGKMGRSEGYVNHRLALAKRPPEILQMAHTAALRGQKVMTHAEEIERVTDKEEQANLIKKVLDDKASVETIRADIQELDRRKPGVVKPKKVVGRKAPENGSIGGKTKTAVIYVDWKAINVDGRNATYKLLSGLRTTKPVGENKELMIELVAAMKKDLAEAQELLKIKE